MCGIAGIVSWQGRVERDLVMRMSQRLAHRGMDGDGLWMSEDERVGLAHRRLAIRDLSQAGAQPMEDPGGNVVVSFNGEIYNDAQLRAELERNHGCIFRTRCDTEVIPAGWLVWGDGLFDRLEGMFAIAIWDRRDKKLVLARDCFGIKPLYVAAHEGRVSFASEIKAILVDDGIPHDLSTSDIHTFLAQGYPSPDRTLLKHVRQVCPGGYEVFSQDGVRKETYWSPHRGKSDLTSAEDVAEAFDAVWPQVVHDHLVSDVPVSVLQSGGVDSSLISLELTGTTQRVDYNLYNAGFSRSDFDERHLAELMARKVGTSLSGIQIDLLDDPEKNFRNVVHHTDGQLADASCFALYAICGRVAQDVKVALSGDGGDELFAGYDTYKASMMARLVAPVTSRLFPDSFFVSLSRRLAMMGGGSDNVRRSQRENLVRFLYGLGIGQGGYHACWRHYVTRDMYPEIYGPELAGVIETDPYSDYKAALNLEGQGGLTGLLLADQSYYLPGDLLVKSDRMSMAHGLELRVPFLDRRIVDLAQRINPSLLTGYFGKSKSVLRETAYQRGVPREIAHGRKKGFNMPVSAMLKGALKALADEYFLRRAEIFSPYLRPEGVVSVWNEHLAGRRDHSYFLWALLTFGVWLESLPTYRD